MYVWREEELERYTDSDIKLQGRGSSRAHNSLSPYCVYVWREEELERYTVCQLT
jgi:hypothetical protein